MTFEAWMSKVDAAFNEALGISHEEWPDQTYYDWFEDGIEPMEAVALAVENEYGYTACCELGLEGWL